MSPRLKKGVRRKIEKTVDRKKNAERDGVLEA
jgi:hypothetical protein